MPDASSTEGHARRGHGSPAAQDTTFARTTHGPASRRSAATIEEAGASPARVAPTSVDELAGDIQRRVMTGEIAIGSWLRQERLAREYGVSRTPVREAIRKLQAMGLVDLVPNRGAYVRGPTMRDIYESYVVRVELEGLAAEIAATMIDDGRLDELERAQRLFENAAAEFAALTHGARAEQTARAEWIRANDLFHTAIQLAAGNERLRQAIVEVHRAFPRSLTALPLIDQPSLLEANIEEHRAILRALHQRDAVAARAAMRDHVTRSGDLVARWFATRRRPSEAPGV